MKERFIYMDNLEYIKERLKLWYEYINRELFFGVMPSAVFELSNQGLDKRRTVKSQFVKYKNHEYCIRLAKASLNKPDELMAFMIHQMINVYCIENNIIEPNKRYLGPAFNNVCKKYNVITEYSEKTGYRVIQCPESYNKFKDFLFTDEWKEAVHLVINSGITSQAKRNAEKMEYFICPKCRTLVKTEKNMLLKCVNCDLVIIPIEEFLNSYYEGDSEKQL